MKIRELIFFVAVIISIPQEVNSQELKKGDSTVVPEIKRKTSKIYETNKKRSFYLTRKTFQKKAVLGTEVQLWSDDNSVNRVLTKSFTKKGLLGVEYYFNNEELIYVYAAFEYFTEENSDAGEYVNFKGLKSWESRFYFKNNKLAYTFHKGIKDKLMSGKELIHQVEKIKMYLTKNKTNIINYR